jgi:ornithine decarboxylase
MVDSLFREVDTPSAPDAAPQHSAEGTCAQRRIRAFTLAQAPPTPCLLMDLPTVRARYDALRTAFTSAGLPDARIFYAVKANPAPEVVRTLVAAGSSFDVASPAEIALCLAQGAVPEQISYGNTIKKGADIAYAYRQGVRLYTTDSLGDVAQIARHAPGSAVFCRVLVSPPGAATPFGRKFGCSTAMAVDVLRTAAGLGLVPYGVSFHVGSQQTNTDAWRDGIRQAAEISTALAAEGITLAAVNLGGGFPASGYRNAVPPPLPDYATDIRTALADHFGSRVPAIILEPGRAIVAEAGLIRTEVVLVSTKDVSTKDGDATTDQPRWVYLDIGRYGGLAETEGEAISYELVTHHADQPSGPVILAGPTCDGDDVLYQRTVYHLPFALTPGDQLEILNAGAYTASYSSVSFNGFQPLATYVAGAHIDAETTTNANGALDAHPMGG